MVRKSVAVVGSAVLFIAGWIAGVLTLGWAVKYNPNEETLEMLLSTEEREAVVSLYGTSETSEKDDENTEGLSRATEQ